jgi:hypothetical protein
MDLSGVSNQPATQSVADAIRDAANATGQSFQYLLATARAESGLNPQAAATTSSARGLYQFVDQTWLAAMKHSGASLGYGQYADAIVQTAAGRYEVSDPTMRRNIMALRNDPSANAALAGALTKDNAAQLAGRLGRTPTDSELYVAHVLGAAGASKLATLAAASPGAPADIAFPAAAAANRAIFYDRQGHTRSVSDVFGILTGRYAGHRMSGAASLPMPLAGGSTAAPQLPLTAGAAYLNGSMGAPAAVTGVFAGLPGSAATAAPATATGALAGTASAAPDSSSQSAPLFAGLFSDRREPVSRFVHEAWTQSTPLPSPGAAPSSPSSPSSGASLVATNGSRQLFQAPNGLGLFGR